jgi:hypothetical protein
MVKMLANGLAFLRDDILAIIYTQLSRASASVGTRFR